MYALSPTAIIAEDEALLAEAFKLELARAWPELRILASAPDGPAALRAVYKHQPDVAFLDIRMPGMSGLDVAQALVEDWPVPKASPARVASDFAPGAELDESASTAAQPPLLVFVTAYDAPAIEAFELAAVDYLLKPVEHSRLQVCVTRLQQRLRERAQPGEPLQHLIEQLRPLLTARSAVGMPVERLRNITASVGNQVRVVPLDHVLYLQSTDKYVNVVHQEGSVLLRSSLSALEPRLDDRFVRIHRGCIVNIDYVAAAIRDEHGRIRAQLRNRNELLPVSRLYTHHFRPM